MRRLTSTALVLACALLACDGGGADFTPCGGDPVGEWRLTDIALGDLDDGLGGLNEACSGASVNVSIDAAGTGTITETTLSLTTTRLVTLTTVNVPASCLPQGTSCSDVSQFVDGGSCQSSGAGCRCTVSAADQAAQFTATTINYILEGDSLVVPGGRDEARLPYCVDGDRLKLDLTPLVRGFGTTQATYTFKRQ